MVIYPPVDLKESSIDINNYSNVVTIGSFHPEKRQLEQIRIASQLPEINFNIIGHITSKKYYNKCKNYISSHSIDNVTLYPNCSYSSLIRILNKSTIFLHNKRYEHFGISTVEAIDSNCIPIVHNSGGQKEVVPLKKLRYDNIEEATNKIKRILNLKIKNQKFYVKKLKKHIQNNFDSKTFKKRINKIFNEIQYV